MLLRFLRFGVILFGIFGCVIGNVAVAQDVGVSQRQAEILRNALRVDGNLTKTQYDEFWKDFQHLPSEGRERFRQELNAAAPAILNYQRAVWLAAKESLRQHKVVITPSLKKELNRGKEDPDGKSEKQKRKALELLEAAACGKSIEKNGQNVQVTAEMIDQVLDGLDKSFSRLQRLLAPTWHP